jgi:hypothetical protein
LNFINRQNAKAPETAGVGVLALGRLALEVRDLVDGDSPHHNSGQNRVARLTLRQLPYML